MKVTNVLELPVIDSVFVFSSYFHINMCLLAFIVFEILFHIFIFLRFTDRVTFKQTLHNSFLHKGNSSLFKFRATRIPVAT